MSEPDFPSGPWIGFYVYGDARHERHRMDLMLTFANGVMSGEGNDDIGMFVIRGRYDPVSKECHWTKSYVGAHDVFYQGVREGRGIWGTWSISESVRGGFHIWPLDSGTGDAGVEEQAEELPQETAVAVQQR
ncbi:MAG: hypothetical protein N3B01_07700 [Verrucomicrobiae bacterium]|nr:hypothetical protein [Verrucomicrobiae bacterium]